MFQRQTGNAPLKMSRVASHPLYERWPGRRLDREDASKRLHRAGVQEELLGLVRQRRREQLLQQRLQAPQDPCHQLSYAKAGFAYTARHSVSSKV